MRCNGKPQPQTHSGGIALYLGVDKLLDAGEGDDSIEAFVNLSLSHAKNRSVEIDILPTRQFFVESGSHFQQGRNAPLNLDIPFSRVRNLRQDLEQRALSRSVFPNDADNFSLVDVERHILQCPDRIRRLTTTRKGVLAEFDDVFPECRPLQELSHPLTIGDMLDF